MAAVTDTIGTTGRDFSTITLWEASLSAHSGDDVTGECYNDSAFDEKPTINDATPTSVALTVASGERHDGTEGTGARILLTSSGTSNLITFDIAATCDWLEIDANGQNPNWIVDANVAGGIMRKLIAHGTSSSGSIQAVVGGNSGDSKTLNCIVYDVTCTGAGSESNLGLNCQAGVSLNNTVHGMINNNGTGICTCINYRENLPSDYRNNIGVAAGGTSSGTVTTGS